MTEIGYVFEPFRFIGECEDLERAAGGNRGDYEGVMDAPRRSKDFIMLSEFSEKVGPVPLVCP